MKEKLIEDLCLQEIENACYNVKIDDISVYNFIRRSVRCDFLAQNGIEHIDYLKKGSKIKRVHAIVKSFFQLLRLPSNVKFVFKTFRLENINNLWMDKFYDPIIEECLVKDNYIILESNYGRMYSNRIHKDKVYYDDALLAIVNLITPLCKHYYKKKYKTEFDHLFNSVAMLIGKDFSINKANVYSYEVVYGLLKVKLYSKLLKKIGAQCIIGASRSNFLPLICSAKKSNIKVCELQHGIGYGVDVTYGGYRDSAFTPDIFFMFGNVKPRDVYGIEDNRIIIIGWALKNYLGKIRSNTSIKENDVLVLSQPNLTNYTVKSLMYIANHNPSCNFYLRCHPMENLNEDQIKMIENQPNIFIQDNCISFVVGVMPFKNVIGTQSTAVYEALSYGKKTGILAMNNYDVRYLQEEDAESFWIIKDNSSFVDFLKGNNSNKKEISIYSTFNKDVFLGQIN